MEYYYHGTESLDQMIEIIESGGIKSKNKRNANYDTLYNGDDYISLGKWDNNKKADFTNMYDSCFYGWIFWRPTFIINPDIDALHALPRIGEFDPNVDRVSPFQDEYHVKDEIELDKIVGIALPFIGIAIYVVMFMIAFGKQREQEAKEREQYYSGK